MKKILVCCDGTWNEPESNTHIFRISEAAERLGYIEGTNLYYDTGVGADARKTKEEWIPWIIDKVSGGVFGLGISENIRDAYKFIADVYEDGDELYLTGFSRGAFTVRSLCGFIKFAGLLIEPEDEDIDVAYEAYRKRRVEPEVVKKWLKSPKAQDSRQNIPIQFLGVFDTVGSLGIPIGWMQRVDEWFRPARKVRFHDTQLGGNVRNASHALAVDEQRGPFQPTFWTGAEAPEQRIRQAWFPGVHSDIGGGYEDKALADVTLSWMLDEMAFAGLDLRDGFEGSNRLKPDATGKMHNSMTFAYRAVHLASITLKKNWRKIASKTKTENGTEKIPHSSISRAVQRRISKKKVMYEDQMIPYLPGNLVLDDAGRIVIPRGMDAFERREFVRKEKTLRGRIDGLGACTILNLSRGGARVHCSAGGPDAAMMREHVVRLVTNDPLVAAREATIRWVEDQHVGLEFEEPLSEAA